MEKELKFKDAPCIFLDYIWGPTEATRYILYGNVESGHLKSYKVRCKIFLRRPCAVLCVGITLYSLQGTSQKTLLFFSFNPHNIVLKLRIFLFSAQE